MSLPPLRAVVVSVDYSDLLALTLPHNRHHFAEVLVVTSWADIATQQLAKQHDCTCYATNAFYNRGADFNKWAALEEGLDFFGRRDWLCLLDADVLWPQIIPPQEWRPGCLYTPRRRMFPVIPPTAAEIPPEEIWDRWPVHRNEAEFAGYTQIFHADDPALPPPPWHQIDWKHAGGADSFFQLLWSPLRKIRPLWEVLHLGEAGRNWCGRATAYADGTAPTEARERQDKLSEYMRGRRGKEGDERFIQERLEGGE